MVVIGGYTYNHNESKYSNALLELKGISSKKWVPLKQTLQHAKKDHVAIAIPDDWTIPNTDEVKTKRKQKAQKQLLMDDQLRK